MSNDENPLLAGSKPAARTSFTEQIEGFKKSDTGLAQNSAESENRKMQFPQIIRQKRIEATIYGRSTHYRGRE